MFGESRPYYTNHLWGDPSLVMRRHDIHQFCTVLRPDRQINHSVNDRPWTRQNGPKSCGIIHARTDRCEGYIYIYIRTYAHNIIYRYTVYTIHRLYLWYLKILKKVTCRCNIQCKYYLIWYASGQIQKNSPRPPTHIGKLGQPLKELEVSYLFMSLRRW